jgi:hypothetical protein
MKNARLYSAKEPDLRYPTENVEQPIARFFVDIDRPAKKRFPTPACINESYPTSKANVEIKKGEMALKEKDYGERYYRVFLHFHLRLY